MGKFEINSEFLPTGDQPQAIDELVKGSKTKMNQTLLGVTGSGKTFTVANVQMKEFHTDILFHHVPQLPTNITSRYFMTDSKKLSRRWDLIN